MAGAITSMGIDELVSKLAIGIARGQLELDRVCMEIAQFMGDAQIAFGKRADSDEPDMLSLVELGFTPNFYQFVDTVLEVRVAVSSKFEETREYDTSKTQAHTDSYNQQSQYESQRRAASSGWNYRAGGGWGWYGWGYGAGGNSYSSSNQAKASSSSSYKSTNLALTTVDAKYASTYNYAVEASSLIKTKIVPVPPPEVFEEIVRSKLQQRRDEEQRLRLLNQAIAILGGLVGSANDLIADTVKFPDLATNYQRETAVALQDALNKLNEDYERLTTDHWAVINSVEDRKTADDSVDQTLQGATQILERYPEGNTTPDDPAVVKTLLAEIKTSRCRYQAQRAGP